MNSMKWLIRRELWEHKGALIWTPVIVAALLLLFIGGGMAYALFAGKGLALHINNGDVLQINGIPSQLQPKISTFIASSYLAMSAPLMLVLPIVVFFYCLSALYDERRDRSVLFWKSLPISDEYTVLSKAAVALLIAPVMVVVLAILNALLILIVLLIVSATQGLNLVSAVLLQGDLYLSPFYLLSLVPVYILWALPTVGWLLMVSSWARSRVFLWAVGVPLVALGLLAWLNFLLLRFTGEGINVSWFGEEVVVRILLGLVPGIWFGELKVANTQGENIMIGGADILSMSYSTLASPLLWIAAAAGCLMIYAAMRLRRWRDEG